MLTRPRSDDGFTLIELVVTVAIVGIIVAGLGGVIIRFLQDTVDTQARLTESHDVQFTAAYWQHDVASIGLRSSTYDATTHSFALTQSVAESGSLATCSLPTGTKVVTLAWSEYSSLDSQGSPDKVTVTYVAQPDGAVYQLLRVRCEGGTVDSTIEVAHNLRVVPTVACVTASGGTGCAGAGSDVPAVVKLSLDARTADAHGSASYTATLVGQRRQT
ncbi:type II secretion system protein J [Nocardioides sp. MH1]|uniref:PulJ/GspJ family protein n=1 Tax=Nocardioides sp. MH1 TaxID=3242490 RepID=UPI003520E036